MDSTALYQSSLGMTLVQASRHCRKDLALGARQWWIQIERQMERHDRSEKTSCLGDCQLEPIYEPAEIRYFGTDIATFSQDSSKGSQTEA